MGVCIQTKSLNELVWEEIRDQEEERGQHRILRKTWNKG